MARRSSRLEKLRRGGRCAKLVTDTVDHMLNQGFMTDWSAVAVTCHDVADQVATRRAGLVRDTPLPDDGLFALPAVRARLRAALAQSLSCVALEREIESLRARIGPGPAAMPDPVPNHAHPGLFMPPVVVDAVLVDPLVEPIADVDATHRFVLEFRLVNGATFSRVLEPSDIEIGGLLDEKTHIKIRTASDAYLPIHVARFPSEWGEEIEAWVRSPVGAVSLSVVRLRDGKISILFKGPALPDVLQWDFFDEPVSFRTPRFRVPLPGIEALRGMLSQCLEIELETHAVVVCDAFDFAASEETEYQLNHIDIGLDYRVAQVWSESSVGDFADRAALCRFLDLTARWT